MTRCASSSQRLPYRHVRRTAGLPAHAVRTASLTRGCLWTHALRPLASVWIRRP
jgi:hypothetical protein